MAYLSLAPFVRMTGFSDDEKSNKAGRSTVDTVGLDTEFINVKATLDALINDLLMIQRTDGELADEIVKIPSLHPDVISHIAQALPPVTLSSALLFAVDDGSANAYHVDISPPPEAYFTGMTIWMKAANGNTGDSTLEVGTLGAVPIRKDVSQLLEINDIKNGQMMVFQHDGTNFQIINPFLSIGSHTSNFLNPHGVTKTQVGLGSVSNALQLIASNNLSDLPSAATARSNLGVQTAIDQIGESWKVLAKNNHYTVQVADRWKLIAVDATSLTITITLPLAATAGDGFIVAVKKTDATANTVVVDGNGAELIDEAAAYTLVTQGDAIIAVCDGTKWHIVSEKNLAAATDEFVKISADDTTRDYLENKITVSGGLVKTTTSPAGNEKLDFLVRSRMQVFTEDGTWVRDTTASKVLVLLIGGGAGGGADQGTNDDGSGGGGAAAIFGWVTVTDDVTISIGQGSAGATGTGTAADGGTTSFGDAGDTDGVLMTAVGGKGGKNNHAGGAGGDGDNCTIADESGLLWRRSGVGGQSSIGGGAGLGGASGADPWDHNISQANSHVGGGPANLLPKASNSAVDGAHATTPGGGGAGSQGATNPGRNGAKGLCIVWW